MLALALLWDLLLGLLLGWFAIPLIGAGLVLFGLLGIVMADRLKRAATCATSWAVVLAMIWF